jgi:NAD(P)-dependent dehydrogenase (short-subunit alcohol dehydrogenase family)
LELDGRVAVVTGGATGIGRAIGLKLAERGAAVVVWDLNADAARGTSADIAALGVESHAADADVTDPGGVAAAAADALARLGRIDILVNNAGVAGAPGWHEQPVSREEDWTFAFEVNVKGMATVTNAIAPHMQERGSGKIVNISSIAGREGRPSLPHYSATKAAVINYTQSLANELGADNINVNAVCPGLLWTPMWEQVGARYARTRPELDGMSPREVFDRTVEELIPLKREQTPEDIGDLVAFLVSEDAMNITGQAINVDGGAFLR